MRLSSQMTIFCTPTDNDVVLYCTVLPSDDNTLYTNRQWRCTLLYCFALRWQYFVHQQTMTLYSIVLFCPQTTIFCTPTDNDVVLYRTVLPSALTGEPPASCAVPMFKSRVADVCCGQSHFASAPPARFKSPTSPSTVRWATRFLSDRTTPLFVQQSSTVLPAFCPTQSAYIFRRVYVPCIYSPDRRKWP